MSPKPTPSGLGPLVRLWGMRASQLPAPEATADELAPFLAAILREAVPFIDSAAPQASPANNETGANSNGRAVDAPHWKHKTTKAHPDSAARVSVSERIVPASELRAVAVAANHSDNSTAYVSTPHAQQHQPRAASTLMASGADDPSGGGASSSNSSSRSRGAGAAALGIGGSPWLVGNSDRGTAWDGRRLGPETWCCRRSVHADSDAASDKSASWAEFDRYFRREHAAAEASFTPDIRAAVEALSWNGACAAVEPVVVRNGDGGSSDQDSTAWGGFRLVVQEMRHHVGAPLRDRTFPVLQMSCGVVRRHHDGGSAVAADPEDNCSEFLVVSIPVPDFGEAEASRLASEKDAQIAVYVSVERIRRLPVPARGDGDALEQQSRSSGDIEWLMATASDAGGVLPAWIQNLAMPAVVWKDVPLFLGWVARERGRDKDTTEGAVAMASGSSEGKQKRQSKRRSGATLLSNSGSFLTGNGSARGSGMSSKRWSSKEQQSQTGGANGTTGAAGAKAAGLRESDEAPQLSTTTSTSSPLVLPEIPRLSLGTELSAVGREGGAAASGTDNGR